MFDSKAVIKFSLCLFLLCGCASGQAQQSLLLELVCIQHEECGACLSAASHCRWCADQGYKSTVPRCHDEGSLIAAGCDEAKIQRPDPPVWEVAEDRPLQDVPAGSQQTDNVVQIQPQLVRLSMKPRETRKIKFSYRPARNYPLDLYYLMDLTWSMKDDKETLVSLRDDLPDMLKNLTDNFKLGFGSFAEKPVMPFINVDPHRKANPCTMQEDGVCEATYTYRHRLSLTNQVSDFIENVNRSPVTANLDNAEAQLDALVQVLACGAKIGWSDRTRKIVMVLTDGLMHVAGDGLLGGAIRKNDAQCHLDENGYYSEAATYDYPSVEQVYRLLDKYKVNVIFAVTENVKSHYDRMQELLKDFTHITLLENDSSNVLKLVKSGYDAVVSVVDFADDSYLGPVKIKYFTDCGVKGGALVESTRCTGVGFGMTLNYEAHVTLNKCPEFKKSKQTIKIVESKLGQDSLTLEVDIQCGCHCQEEPPDEAARATCGDTRHPVCGVCLCNEGWSGPNCDCSIKDREASEALEAQCRQPNATSYYACSGDGDCVCGLCECDRGFRGKFCECKACLISLENGMECGEDVGRGVCACGTCVCAEGWSGDACDCTDSKDACTAPGTSEVCSGRGDCACGRCRCSDDEDGNSYQGAYCESCATCENPLCATAEPCVACHLNSSCTDLCSIGGSNYTVAERLDDPVTDNADEVSCIFRQYSEKDQLECEYKYTYTAGTKAMVAMEIIIRSKECYQPTSAKIMTSSIIIMACVIAAGIIVILFVKGAQVVSDRRAYAKFLQEANESRKQTHELNPLYISPISEFRLPESYPRDLN